MAYPEDTIWFYERYMISGTSCSVDGPTEDLGHTTFFFSTDIICDSNAGDVVISGSTESLGKLQRETCENRGAKQDEQEFPENPECFITSDFGSSGSQHGEASTRDDYQLVVLDAELDHCVVLCDPEPLEAMHGHYMIRLVGS